MIRIFALSILALSIAACGVQRPLMRPKDIPAYEEQQRKRKADIEKEIRELEAIDAKRAAERNAVVTPVEPAN